MAELTMNSFGVADRHLEFSLRFTRFDIHHLHQGRVSILHVEHVPGADGHGGMNLGSLGRLHAPQDFFVRRNQLHRELMGEQQIAVGEDDEAAVLRLGVFACLLFPSVKRVLS